MWWNEPWPKIAPKNTFDGRLIFVAVVGLPLYPTLMKCFKCGSKFPYRVKVNGVIKNLHGRRYCLICSPFGKNNRARLELGVNQRVTWKEATFRVAVKSSKTVSEVLRKIGLKATGSNWRTVKKYAKVLSLDTSHFLGRRACYGLVHKKKTYREVFCKESSVSRGTLRSHLKRFLKYECCACGIGDTYNGKSLVLQVEHKNGVSNDNRRKNLEWRCPNCHSQTTTFAGRSAKRNRAIG